MEESTDVVSVADVRLEDSIATFVSLSFDELDIWIEDPPQPSLNGGSSDSRQNKYGGVKYLKIRNGQFKMEQEETTKIVRKDSTDFVGHTLLHKETNAPP